MSETAPQPKSRLDEILIDPTAREVLSNTVEKIARGVQDAARAEAQPYDKFDSAKYVGVAEDGSTLVVSRNHGPSGAQFFAGYSKGNNGSEAGVYTGAGERRVLRRGRSQSAVARTLSGMQTVEFNDKSVLTWNKKDIDAGSWQHDPNHAMHRANAGEYIDPTSQVAREDTTFTLTHADGTRTTFTPLNVAEYEANQNNSL